MTIIGFHLRGEESNRTCNEGTFASEQRPAKFNNAQPSSKLIGFRIGHVSRGVKSSSLVTAKFMGTGPVDLNQRAALAAIYKPAQHSI